MPHPSIPDSYQITASGFRRLKWFGAFLKPYFESYRVVLLFIRNNRKENLEKKDKLKKIQNLGLLMIKNKEMDRVESVSKINYANGLQFFSASGISDYQDESHIAHFETIILSYLNTLAA
jgi:glycerol-3-phosphate O-acyltransferase